MWHNIPVGPFGRHPDFVVLHPQLGELKKAEDIEDDVRLTYVAITRATHEAFVTYSNMSELVGRLVV